MPLLCPTGRSSLQKQPPPSLNRAAPRSGSSPRTQKQRPCSLSPIAQPRAARELPQKQPLLYSVHGAAPRSGSSPRSSHFSPSTEQPRRAAGARPPEASASSLSQSSSSPAQRELPQKQPLLSVHGAARPPRSGSSPRSISLLPLSIEQQPCAAGAPPEAASSLSQSSSPAQRELPPEAASSLRLLSSSAHRELPQKELPPSLYQLYGAAPHSGSSPRSSLLPLWSSPAQRELPQKQPLLSLYRLIEQPRAAGAPPEAASSLSQSSSSPAQRELPQK